jgi:hypothetical protein
LEKGLTRFEKLFIAKVKRGQALKAAKSQNE